MSLTTNISSNKVASSVDVALSNPASSDVLTYDASVKKWKNAPVDTTIPGTTKTANYTLVMSDAGQVIEMNSASVLTLTVPANASVAFPVGTVVEVCQLGTGQVTVAAAAGVTIRTSSSLTTRTQYSCASIRKRATDEWVLSGDLT